MSLRRRLPLVFGLSGALIAGSAAFAAVDITLDHGVIWQTDKAGEQTMGFLQIHNTGADDTLTKVDCPLAETTTLVDAAGKPLTRLAIPAGQTVTLASNGPHLVLSNPHYQVTEGSLVPCGLTFGAAGEVLVYLNSALAPKAS